MALEIDGIAFKVRGARPEKVVEADFEKRGSRSKGGDVAADASVDPIRPDHHGKGIPAHDALDPALHLLIAGKRRLLAGRNRIQVRSIGREGDINARSLSALANLLKYSPRQLWATLLKNRVE